MKQSYPDSYAWMRRVGTLLSIPLTLGISPVVGCVLGWVMDRVFGTRPFITLVGLLAGFAAGIRETWMLIRRVSAEEDSKDQDAQNNSPRHK